MNELIIAGIVLAFFGMMIVMYAVSEVAHIVYRKLIRRDKRSIIEISKYD